MILDILGALHGHYIKYFNYEMKTMHGHYIKYFNYEMKTIFINDNIFWEKSMADEIAQ